MYFFVHFFKSGRKRKSIAVPHFVFVEYNGNNQVKKRKISKYIFFLSNTFQCDL